MGTFVALAALVLSSQALADQYRPAAQSIWTMSETHLVLHEHDTARQHAELRIIERETGKETYRGESSTFTMLVPVEEGKYFAGLSNHKLHSRDYGYNFALFTPDGEILSRAYITTVTGYCGRVRESVSMGVYWFTDPPDISLIVEEGMPVAVKVGRRCRIPFGDHKETFESYAIKAKECRENNCYRARRPADNAGQCKPAEQVK